MSASLSNATLVFSNVTEWGKDFYTKTLKSVKNLQSFDEDLGTILPLFYSESPFQTVKFSNQLLQVLVLHVLDSNQDLQIKVVRRSFDNDRFVCLNYKQELCLTEKQSTSFKENGVDGVLLKIANKSYLFVKNTFKIIDSETADLVADCNERSLRGKV